MKKLKTGLISLVFVFLSPSVARAADCWDDTRVEDGVVKLKGIECIAETILVYAFRIGGLAVFLMLILGGLKYLTAGGEPEKAAGAQKTLTYAIFGLVLIIISWIVILLIEQFTGVSLTTFELDFT